MANKTIVDLETDLVKPYIDSVKSQLSVGGSINLAPNYLETTADNGITWTKNSDGTVTANGTASANSIVNFTKQSDNWYLPAGTYKITGCPSGGSSTKYYIRVYNVDSSATEIARDYGSGDTFTLAARTRVSMTATIISGQAVSNIVFKPMVTVSTYSGAYVPYAATNEELTERVETLEERISKLGTIYCYDIGNVKQSTKTITITGSSRFLLFATHASNTAKQYMALGVHGAELTPLLTPILTATGITVTVGTDTISVANPDNTNVAVELLVFAGNPTVTWA